MPAPVAHRPGGAARGRGGLRQVARAACLPLWAAAVAWAPAALAQPVQRCESPDGAVAYAAPDCPPGTRPTRSLDDPPKPSERQQREARERAARDQEAAQRLREREWAEAARAAQAREAARQRAEKRERECRQLEQKVAAARSELERAPLSRRAQAERRLQAAQDRHALDCPPR